MEPVRKRAELRQRRNKPRSLAIIPESERLEVPDPPSKLLGVTKRRWIDFWENSDIAPALRTTDIPALSRLFVLYDEWARAYRDVTTEPREPKRRSGETNAMFAVRVAAYQRQLAYTGRLVRGSAGQPILNPLLKYMSDLEKDIRALEDRFGFNLMMRQKLGLDALKARSLEEHNRITSMAKDGGSDADDDPLAALLLPRTDGGRSAAT